MFLNTTKIRDELTADELENYRRRFVAEMEELTKHHGALPATWRQDLSAALEHEKPVITEALVDSINAANLGFTVSLKP